LKIKIIYVFNSLFITNNLHDGSSTKIKLFDINDDVKIENIEIKKIKMAIEKIKIEIGDNTSGLIKKKNEYEKAFLEQKKVVSTEFNKKIVGRKIQIIEKNMFVPNRNIKDIEQQIELMTNEYNLLSNNGF